MPYTGARFAENEKVRVKVMNPGPNRRTPHYLRGRTGRVVSVHGTVSGYAHDHRDDWGPLYSVVFDLPGTEPGGPSRERVVADIHESWLERP